MDGPTLYPTALVGYRSWYPGSVGLRSVGGSGASWAKGLNEAVCLRHRASGSHTVPSDECTCGLYAYHEPGPSLQIEYVGGVVGAIVAGGAVELHHHGFRAQRAEILALLEPRQKDVRNEVAELAEIYNVPVFSSLRKLTEYAERFGIRAPAELLPAPPKGTLRLVRRRVLDELWRRVRRPVVLANGMTFVCAFLINGGAMIFWIAGVDLARSVAAVSTATVFASLAALFVAGGISRRVNAGLY